ncbi:MAG: DF family (seleno)protein [Polyangiaceae bacterium]
MKKIEVLVFNGCPNVEATLARVRESIALTKAEADLRVVCVNGEADAVRLRFLGSPTVRVDGVDVDPDARERIDFGLQCRVYSFEGRFGALPPEAWIAAALLRGVDR